MKKLMLAVALLATVTAANAQWGEEEMSEKPTFRDRVFTGGGIGLSFSNYYSYFSISPLIGYRITPKLAGGVQFQYRWAQYKADGPGGYKINTDNYGASPFLRFQVYGPFFLHTEYEYLNYEYPISQTETKRQNYNSFMAGGGLFQPIGRMAGIYILALYNFSYTDPGPYDYYPYTSPLILRVGVTAGF